MERKIAQKEKEKKEDHLRQLAQKAREERAGIKSGVDEPEEREREQIRHEQGTRRQRERNLSESGAGEEVATGKTARAPTLANK